MRIVRTTISRKSASKYGHIYFHFERCQQGTQMEAVNSAFHVELAVAHALNKDKASQSSHCCRFSGDRNLYVARCGA